MIYGLDNAANLTIKKKRHYTPQYNDAFYENL